jgi:hypothetical protein
MRVPRLSRDSRSIRATSPVVVILLLLGITAGCDGRQDSPTPPQETPASGTTDEGFSYTLADHAYLLEASTVEQLVVEPDRIEVPADADQVVQDRQIGDVLVFEGDGGFWRYIRSAEPVDGRMVYRTRTAHLTEVLEQGEFLITANMPSEQQTPRTRSQALVVADESDTFDLSRDLGSQNEFQFAGNDVELSTSGTLQFRPGYIIYLEIEGGSVAEFEATMTGNLNLDGEFTLAVNDGQPAAPIPAGHLTREVQLCNSGSNCVDGRPTLTWSLLGQDFKLYPTIELEMTWQGSGSGTITGGFGGDGNIKASFLYDHGDDSFEFTDDFDAQATTPESTGEVDVDFKSELSFSMVGEGLGSRLVEVTPFRGNFEMHAGIKPPSCEFQSALAVSGDLRRGAMVGGGSWSLYRETLFDLYHDVDHPGECSNDNTEEVAQCNTDGDCERDEICSAAGYCVEDTPMQIALSWNDPVNLDLEVIDPQGKKLVQGSPGGANQDENRSRDGWMALSSCGGCDDDDPGAGNYGEVALVKNVRADQIYKIAVTSTSDNPDADNLIDYRLNIFNRGGGVDELMEGKLGEGSKSVRYDYRAIAPQ